MESTTKKWKNRKTKKVKYGYTQKIGKQSGKCVKSVRKKKRKAMVGRICRRKVLRLE